jgi:5-formyltetrahydrofolate cyclo-ligase
MEQTVAQEKKQLRAKARKHRLCLDIQDISDAIRHNISQWPLFQQAKTILAYAALPDEVDLLPLVEKNPDKQWYLPRVILPNHLEFYRYQPGDILETGHFGIEEPSTTSSALLPDTPVDLVFVPCLMLDKTGNRLGFGKGYYDQFLARMASDLNSVCVVPQDLLVDALPREPWDVLMRWGITELDITRFNA